MKFSISSGEILSRLQTMGKVIEDKGSIPVLANFLFSVRGSKLIITASNAEMRMMSSVDIVNEEGTDSDVCIPGVKLTEYIKQQGEQPITFYVAEGSQTLKISSLYGEAEQSCASAEDYPAEQPLTGEVRNISMSEATLLTGISTTIFATATDDLRPIMNGIFIDIEPGKVSFVATDTHKMARLIRTDVNTGDITTGFTLNKKPANLLRGILSKTEDPVNISFGDKNVVFETTGYKYSCRLAEGNYPQYKSVIPANNEYRVSINRDDLMKAVSRASVFVDASHLIKCEFFSNSIHLSAQDLDFNCSAKEDVPCEYNGRENLAIGFSSKYLVEILSNIDATDVQLLLSDPSKPCVICPSVNKENEDMLVIIMPMKI